MLGSTTSATLCNTQNTGNIVVVAAGSTGTNSTGVAMSTG